MAETNFTFPRLPDSADFLMMVGKCITDWARIEEVLFYMCQEMLNVSLEQCAIIYYRTPTLETRLQLLDELMNEFFPKPERQNGGHPPKEIKLWGKLLADIRDEMPIRNQLAHQPVGVGLFAQGFDEKGNVIGDVKLEVHSYAANTELARGRSGNRKPLTLVELQKYEPTILALYNRANEFRQGPLKYRIAELAQQAPPKGDQSA